MLEYHLILEAQTLKSNKWAQIIESQIQCNGNEINYTWQAYGYIIY